MFGMDTGQSIFLKSENTICVTDAEKRSILSESKQAAKHPDSVWMNRNTLRNLVFFEFEGCQNKEQLEWKAKNLIRCLYHAQEKPFLLILIYWLKTSEDRTFVQKAGEILEFGFKESGYVFSPPQKAFIIKADFKFTDERAFFKKFVIL